MLAAYKASGLLCWLSLLAGICGCGDGSQSPTGGERINEVSSVTLALSLRSASVAVIRPFLLLVLGPFLVDLVVVCLSFNPLLILQTMFGHFCNDLCFNKVALCHPFTIHLCLLSHELKFNDCYIDFAFVYRCCLMVH